MDSWVWWKRKKPIRLRGPASSEYNGLSETVEGDVSLVDSRVVVLSSSQEMTHAIGIGVGRTLQSGDVVCLQGELGSGKTHLTKGIAVGLGLNEPVTSPTFIIVNEYAIPGRRYRLYHIDLYRVESLAEALATGLDEYWSGEDICVIEWAERARPILPADHLWVNLDYCGSVSRRLEFEAFGPRSTDVLRQIEPTLHKMGAERDRGHEAMTCS